MKGARATCGRNDLMHDANDAEKDRRLKGRPFKLGHLSSVREKGVKPNALATFPAILAAIDSAALTPREAHILSLRAIARAREIAKPLNHDDPAFYRAETSEEHKELEDGVPE